MCLRAILSSLTNFQRSHHLPISRENILPSPGNKLEVGSCGRLYYVPMRIQVSDKLYLWSGDYPGTSRWPSVITGLSNEEEGGGGIRTREMTSWEKSHDVASLGNGEREPWAKEHNQLLEAEKGKETESPLEVTKVMLTFWFDQWSPFWISGLQTKR